MRAVRVTKLAIACKTLATLNAGSHISMPNARLVEVVLRGVGAVALRLTLVLCRARALENVVAVAQRIARDLASLARQLTLHARPVPPLSCFRAARQALAIVRILQEAVVVSVLAACR